MNAKKQQQPFTDRFLTELVQYGMLLLQTLDYRIFFKSFKLAVLYGYYKQALVASYIISLMTFALPNLYAWPVTLPII